MSAVIVYGENVVKRWGQIVSVFASRDCGEMVGVQLNEILRIDKRKLAWRMDVFVPGKEKKFSIIAKTHEPCLKRSLHYTRLHLVKLARKQIIKKVAA